VRTSVGDFGPLADPIVGPAGVFRGKARGAAIASRLPVLSDQWKKTGSAAALVCLTVLAASGATGALLTEDGFNYAVGSPLATNTPWSGLAGSSLSIAGTNLFLGTVRSTIPAGNCLEVSAGTAGTAYLNFTNIPVTGGFVYCSFLIDVLSPPTSSHLAAALLPTGMTAPGSPNDPLDVSIRPSSNGYVFSVSHTGVDPVSTHTILAPRTPHLVVVKYDFGGYGQASVFVDPTPGGTEPSPDAQTENSDDGSDAPNLQVFLLSATGTSSQGTYLIDTLRIGTIWSDVTPAGIPVTIAGPTNQAICAGSPADFSITASGSPPLFYQWRSNRTSLANETNSSLLLADPQTADTLASFDVVVTGPYGSATSQVAGLSISSQGPAIVAAPTNIIVWPGSTNATFSASISGDAPLSFQWTTNGVPIPGATNSFYTLSNVVPSNASLQFALEAVNPCGSVAAPAVSVIFPHAFLAAEGLPAFFSGVNLITTNTSGQTLFAWSSSDLAPSVANWFLEGPLSEQPLNDGSGNSIYSINVNPLTPLVYYLIGSANTPPYVNPVLVNSVATDNSGNYTFAVSSDAITSWGTLIFPGTPPPVSIQSSSSSVQLSGLAVPGAIVWVQASDSMAPPVNWITIATNTAGPDGAVNFRDTISSLNLGRFYRLVSP